MALKCLGPKSPGRPSIWLCKCDCGNTHIVLASNLIRGKLTSCGCDTNSKGELKIEEVLKENNICYKKQYKFKDLRGKSKP